MERSYLTNGHFLHSLDGWSADGGATYSAGDGDDQYGVASLPPGSSISQAFAVDRARRYTLHLAVKGGNATIQIQDGNGNSLPSQTANGGVGVWTESSLSFGLAPGTTYRLTISNAGAATIAIDDVWLWWVPQTRTALAEAVHRKLGQLAADAGLTTIPATGQTEGSYTDAVDTGLRTVGAIDPETDQPDVRALDTTHIDGCMDAIERAMLERLQWHYAVLTDITVGDRDEKLSQIGAALARIGGSQRRGTVIMRPLRRRADDYEFS